MSTFHEMIAHNLHPSLSLSLSRRYYIPSHTRTEDESSRASIPGDVQRSPCRLIFSSVPDAKNMIGARRCSHGYVSAHAVEERRRRENRRFSVARGRTRGVGRRRKEGREGDAERGRRSEQLVRKIKEKEGLVRSPATGWMRTRTWTRGLQERGMETLGEKRRETRRVERKREKRGRRWPEGRQRRRSERVKRVRRRNGWKANRGDQEGGRGYQERTSQVAVRWRIIIVASSVSRISFLRALRYYKRGHVNRVCAYSRWKITDRAEYRKFLLASPARDF